MKWRKMGRVYAPDGSLPWAKKYGIPPTPHVLDDGTLRMYVGFCDDGMVGRMGYVDLDPEDPARVLDVAREPLLDIGRPGTFDDNGVLPSSLVAHGGRLYMYYTGYQLGVRVRYYMFNGLAYSDDGGRSFSRAKSTPVTDRSDAETHNRTSAFVMRDGGVFKMWYVGGSDWVESLGRPRPVYNMRYLESPDGVAWGPEGRVVMDFGAPGEHAFGRPWVLKEGGRYRMLYSYRSTRLGYRIGYAESADGLRWERKDHLAGIDVSPSGWDSETISYSSVVRHRGRVYLFYNGNNCGETGFGYATLEEW
jgi:predicted GH43/DUF377 family glycosyl hydrolase